jgi:hypothetical protein
MLKTVLWYYVQTGHVETSRDSTEAIVADTIVKAFYSACTASETPGHCYLSLDSLHDF